MRDLPTSTRMAKASPHGTVARAEWLLLGECLNDARWELRWTLDRLARELDRDEKQVGRWIRGEERPQVETIVVVPLLGMAYAIALAGRVGCVVETVVRLTRLA